MGQGKVLPSKDKIKEDNKRKNTGSVARICPRVLRTLQVSPMASKTMNNRFGNLIFCG